MPNTKDQSSEIIKQINTDNVYFSILGGLDYYEVIESAINKRERVVQPFRNYDRDRIRKYLPVDTFMEELQDEKSAFIKLRLLNQLNTMPNEIEEFVSATRPRHGFVNDYMGGTHSDTSTNKTFSNTAKIFLVEVIYYANF